MDVWEGAGFSELAGQGSTQGLAAEQRDGVQQRRDAPHGVAPLWRFVVCSQCLLYRDVLTNHHVSKYSIAHHCIVSTMSHLH